MGNFDVDVLLQALENENNEEILELNSDKIDENKMNSLMDLDLDDETISSIMEKLKNYIAVSDIPDLKAGSFIRWIPLNRLFDNDDIKLTKGAIVCDINICQNGTYVVCKSRFNKYMQIKMDECIIFRKLNSQESVLLSAINYLSK
tara:strand:+ start:251 stop:688 length:438 start_codon:yes stop_codon:yes gene_type:complete